MLTLYECQFLEGMHSLLFIVMMLPYTIWSRWWCLMHLLLRLRFFFSMHAQSIWRTVLSCHPAIWWRGVLPCAGSWRTVLSCHLAMAACPAMAGYPAMFFESAYVSYCCRVFVCMCCASPCWFGGMSCHWLVLPCGCPAMICDGGLSCHALEYGGPSCLPSCHMADGGRGVHVFPFERISKRLHIVYCFTWCSFVHVYMHNYATSFSYYPFGIVMCNHRSFSS